ncbi:hypothetical protein PRZ48_007316 [Zasmidium cellare]|uniref:Cytochrome P450 n=1 Tax=Zasmidium cellare TaxID=395010 RepID=A0ABR0EJ88_ZASCE|nr:hypothetical protein PRZ48_007316 [Zasmidium cellare]
MAGSYVASNVWTIAAYAAVFLISCKAVVYIQRLFFHPLSKFPGPKIMAASRIYEFYYDSYQHGRLWRQLPELHKKYGPIIRMGPDEIHIQDSEYFDYLFGFKPLDKWPMSARQFGLNHAMFGTEDYKLYTQRRAAFGDAFSRSKTFKLQPLVNEKTEKGCDQIRAAMRKGTSIDLAYLYRAVTAEIITEYMYGQQYGFFEDQKTTKGLYDRRFDALFGFTHLGRFIPFWIPILLIFARSQIRQALGVQEATASMVAFSGFADKMLKNIVDEHGVKEDVSEDKQYKTAAEVYLHSRLPIPDKTGQGLTQATMAAWAGGWDTTAFSLTQTSYYLLRCDNVLKKLKAELNKAWPQQATTPTYQEILELPYLDAVIKESLRLMHGALSRLTRINPTAAEQYKSWTIPPKTKISMSTSDVNLDKSIWGEDVEEFRPERWLGHPELDKWLMTFSKGARVCAGQELAWMELKLIVATIFRKFEMRIPEGEKVTDADILPYCDGFTPGPKNYMQRLPVVAKVVGS